MFDDLDSIFYNQLLLNYDKYRKLRSSRVVGNDQSIILAISCATSLFHFREHFPLAHRKSRSKVVVECNEYRLIADVCNAAKHGDLTRLTSEGPPLVRSASDIYELVVTTKYQDEKGEYSDSEAVVKVDCSDGVTRCLDEAIVKTLNYWGNELNRLGVRKFNEIGELPYPGTQHISRQDAGSVEFVVTQGQRFQCRQQILVFDNVTGKSEPMDLTGHEIRMSIDRPKYSIEVVATPNNGGEPVKIEIEMSDEQSQSYAHLNSDAERDDFVQEFRKQQKEQICQKIAEAVLDAAEATGSNK